MTDLSIAAAPAPTPTTAPAVAPSRGAGTEAGRGGGNRFSQALARAAGDRPGPGGDGRPDTPGAPAAVSDRSDDRPRPDRTEPTDGRDRSDAAAAALAAALRLAAPNDPPTGTPAATNGATAATAAIPAATAAGAAPGGAAAIPSPAPMSLPAGEPGVAAADPSTVDGQATGTTGATGEAGGVAAAGTDRPGGGAGSVDGTTTPAAVGVADDGIEVPEPGPANAGDPVADPAGGVELGDPAAGPVAGDGAAPVSTGQAAPPADAAATTPGRTADIGRTDPGHTTSGHTDAGGTGTDGGTTDGTGELDPTAPPAWDAAAVPDPLPPRADADLGGPGALAPTHTPGQLGSSERGSATPAATPQRSGAGTATGAPEPWQQVGHALGTLRHLTDGSQQIEVRLHPEELGEVLVEVTAVGGELRIHLATDNPVARERLGAELGQLAARLAQSGLQASSLDIGAHTGGDRSADRGRPPSPGGTGRYGDGQPHGPTGAPSTPGPSAAPAGRLDLIL